MADFDKALKYVLENEGGYVDNPWDKGGPTNMGITLAVVQRVLNPKADNNTVKNLTMDQVRQIYRTLYWLPLKGPDIKSDGLATALFDVHVNRGLSKCMRYIYSLFILQGMPTSQMVMPTYVSQFVLEKLNGLDAMAALHDLHTLLSGDYISIVASNPSQSIFLKGWLNRARKIVTLA